MDNYKQLEKTLNHIIKKMNDSRSIFCENSRTDFIVKPQTLPIIITNKTAN